MSYEAGQRKALNQLKLAGFADLRARVAAAWPDARRMLLGAGLLGGAGYLAHKLWNDPLEQNKPVPRVEDPPPDTGAY